MLAKREGEPRAHIVHLPANTGFAAVGQTVQDTPGVDVHHIEYPAMSVIQAAVEQGHHLQLQVAGGGFGPDGAPGNLVAQQWAGW